MSVDTLLVGIGSDHGDDRVGWLVADELKKCEAPGAIVRHAKAPLDLLDWLDGIRCLAICDACRGAGPVGSWHCWNWPDSEFSTVRVGDSHGLGLVEALRLASLLEKLPPNVLFWGIEISRDCPGDILSPEVAAAILPVVSDMSLLFSSPQAA